MKNVFHLFTNNLRRTLQRDWFNYLFISAITLLALYIRYQMRFFQSGDYDNILSKWYRAIQQEGLGVVSGGISNYSPFYEYILFLVSRIFPHLTSLGAIKLPSIISDFICAFFVYRIVWLKFKSPFIPSLAYFSVLFAPTMLLNSALWGQADAIFTAGLLGTIYFLLVGKDKCACIAFGIAISIKLQAIFFLPLVIIMLVKGKISWKAALLIPAVYILFFSSRILHWQAVIGPYQYLQ